MANMASTFTSNQALQATSLVGRSVQIKTTEGLHDGVNGVIGNIELESSTPNLTLSIRNQAGVLVNRIQMNEQASGDIDFRWNGQDADGNPMPAGVYTFEPEAMYNNEPTAVPIYINSNVDSVTLGRPGTGEETVLNVAGAGPIPLSEVREIQ